VPDWPAKVGVVPPVVGALVGWVGLAGVLTGCAPQADTPMSRPVEAMQAPWGPFTRQCASTRVSEETMRWRVGDTDIGDVYETCIGFSSMPSGKDAAEITESVGEPNRPSSTVTLRILRRAGGVRVSRTKSWTVALCARYNLCTNYRCVDGRHGVPLRQGAGKYS
jgi:hypothetical protein